MPTRFLFAAATVVLAVSPVQARPVAARSSEASVDGLIAADRDFARRAGATDLVSALSAMFDAEIVMPIAGGKFARGRDAALNFVRGNAENATSKAVWQPVRGGISADGTQGFTFGFMTVTRAGGATVPMKYLSYWIKRPEGWRVLAYRRVGRPPGEVSEAMLPPALPVRASAPRAANPIYRASVMAAEKGFSDEAQRIGLGPAFVHNGRADAMNIGGGAGFTIGAAAIGNSLDEGAAKTSVHWAADDAAVASSGDLGITWGRIFSNAEPDKAPAAFFTVWKRDTSASPWRYIAE